MMARPLSCSAPASSSDLEAENSSCTITIGRSVICPGRARASCSFPSRSTWKTMYPSSRNMSATWVVSTSSPPGLPRTSRIRPFTPAATAAATASLSSSGVRRVKLRM